MRKLRNVIIGIMMVPLVLGLTSCMRVRTEVNIQSQQQIDATMNVGALKSQADMAEVTSGNELCSQAELGSSTDSNATVEPYDDGEYIGCKITTTGPLSEYSNAITFDESSSQWTFTLPNTGGAGNGQVTSDMVSDFEIKVTFPGEVISASGNGQISGNTVTWSDPADLFSTEGITATAKNTGGFPWLWVIIGVVVVAVVVAVVLLMRRKKQPQPPGQPGGYGGPVQGQAAPYPTQPNPQQGQSPQQQPQPPGQPGGYGGPVQGQAAPYPIQPNPQQGQSPQQ